MSDPFDPSYPPVEIPPPLPNQPRRPQVSEIRKEIIITSKGRAPLYPFAKLEVGECFYVENRNPQVIYSCRRYWQSKFPDRRWNVHITAAGQRVQRIV